MKTICTIENSVMLVSLNSEIIEAALSGKLKVFLSRNHLTDGIMVKDHIYPLIDMNVISAQELSQFDSNNYEHIYNNGVCPLLLRDNVKYARVRIINKKVEGYVAYEIVSRRFVPTLGTDGRPYTYSKNGLDNVEETEGLYCDWNIEYQLGKVVEQHLTKPKSKMRPLTFAKRIEDVIKIYKTMSKNPTQRQTKSLITKITPLIDYTENLQDELEDMKYYLENK